MRPTPQKACRALVDVCKHIEEKYRCMPNRFEPMCNNDTVDTAGISPLFRMRGIKFTRFGYICKRALDIILATFLLTLFSLPMIFIAGLIKIISPGPALFKQERIGLNKKPFIFFKFRSMHLNCDESLHKAYVEKWIDDSRSSGFRDNGIIVHKLTQDPRIIPYFGTFIRKYSIDELPQLFNVIRGDMSLIGPRPCLRYEMQQYKLWHEERFKALPGMTGLWQVSGRNRLSFDEMIQLDIQYIQNWDLMKDLYILLKTPFSVFIDRAY